MYGKRPSGPPTETCYPISERHLPIRSSNPEIQQLVRRVCGTNETVIQWDQILRRSRRCRSLHSFEMRPRKVMDPFQIAPVRLTFAANIRGKTLTKHNENYYRERAVLFQGVWFCTYRSKNLFGSAMVCGPPADP